MVNQTCKVIMLGLRFPRKFQLLKMHRPFSQDRRAKSSTTVSLNSHLLPRQDILQRIPTRLTKIHSWFCHILESTEGPTSSPLLMVMVSTVNLSVNTSRQSSLRRSNSPLSTLLIKLKLIRESLIPLKLRSSWTSRSSESPRAFTRIRASTSGSPGQLALVF